MIKLVMSLFIILLSIYSSILSEIISETDTILYNQNITFLPHNVTINNYMDTISHGGCGLVYICKAPLSDIDIGFRIRDYLI